MGGNCLMNDAGKVAFTPKGAVSYTHLDVYKRQGQSRAVRAFGIDITNATLQEYA